MSKESCLHGFYTTYASQILSFGSFGCMCLVRLRPYLASLCRKHCKYSLLLCALPSPHPYFPHTWTPSTYSWERQAGLVKRSSLWDLPASCPSWPVGQNSSQQEKSKCLKFFAGFYGPLALTFYWWKEIKLNKFYYMLWDS